MPELQLTEHVLPFDGFPINYWGHHCDQYPDVSFLEQHAWDESVIFMWLERNDPQVPLQGEQEPRENWSLSTGNLSPMNSFNSPCQHDCKINCSESWMCECMAMHMARYLKDDLYPSEEYYYAEIHVSSGILMWMYDRMVNFWCRLARNENLKAVAGDPYFENDDDRFRLEFYRDGVALEYDRQYHNERESVIFLTHVSHNLDHFTELMDAQSPPCIAN